MLLVPLLRQLDPVSCFPTVVCAVLRFHGYDPDYDQIAEACGLSPTGTVQERAVQGLAAAEYDVEVLQEFDRQAIVDALAAGRPPIVTLEARSNLPYGHAVVVCGLEGDRLTVMDPMRAAYVELDLSEVLPCIGSGISGVVLIAGAALPHAHEEQA